jgi:hypothetical protein
LADAVAGDDCRYTTNARVTQVSGDNAIDEVYFDVPDQYTPFFLGRTTSSDVVPLVGDQVKVEFWRLKVTRLGGAPTVDNPASDPRPGNLLVIGLLLLALGVGATGWGIVTARRQALTPTPAVGMGPVAMSDVLWR